jgi:hypothetical protein
MDPAGPFCQLELPLQGIVRDLETGDADGDGLLDALVLDSSPALTVIRGMAP